MNDNPAYEDTAAETSAAITENSATMWKVEKRGCGLRM